MNDSMINRTLKETDREALVATAKKEEELCSSS